MSDYLTRKKTLMGTRYTVEVVLEQYGNAKVRVHALSDMAIARIEDKTGYKLEEALAALGDQEISLEDIAALKEATEQNEEAQEQDSGPSCVETPAELTPAELEEKKKKNEEIARKAIEKGSKLISPKMVLFFGELCKEGIVPDPGCECRGKGCDLCDVSKMVEELKGFSVTILGMAIIGASTANWQEVESFFSAKKDPSGAG